MHVDARKLPPSRWPHELERLVQASVRDRRAGIPALGSSDVIYLREPSNQERWQSAADTYARGHGDCEDLAVWLCADLRVAGYPAIVVVKPVRPGLRHAQVLAVVETKSTEMGPRSRRVLLDPSKVRGMKGAG